MAARKHTAATLRIQRRLEKLELEHLRQVVAEQGEQIEQQAREIHYLQGSLDAAENHAEFWRESHNELSECLANDTANARQIGLTKDGALLVVRMQEAHA